MATLTMTSQSTLPWTTNANSVGVLNSDQVEQLSESTPSDVQYEKDDLLYFENIVFKVENTLFCVPKNRLDVAGTPFPIMFAQLQSSDANYPIEGPGTSTHPIEITDTSKADFRGFLRAIYRFPETSLTYEELTRALYLATLWGFTELRNRLICELSPMVEEKPADEQINITRRCEVEHWLLDAYATLIIEPTPDALIELISKGIDGATIAKLFLIREQRKFEAGADRGSRNSGCPCSACSRSWAMLRREAVLQEVKNIFPSELARGHTLDGADSR